MYNFNSIALMTVLSHTRHGHDSKCRQLDVFLFREDNSPLIQEASSVLTNWRCPYRVVKATCELGINYITLFMPGCFVLRMDEFLPLCC